MNENDQILATQALDEAESTLNEIEQSMLLDESSEMEETALEAETEVPELDEERMKSAFLNLLQDARDEDKPIRDDYLAIAHRLDFYWNNMLDIFMDPVSHEWRVPDWNSLENEIPPRLINIYRPHGEAIVAALTITIPSIFFHPDDADNANDVETSRTYRSIVEKNQLHNNAPLQMIQMLVIMFNYGTIFGYNYLHKDPKYGTMPVPRIEYSDLVQFETYCPQCGSPLDGGFGSPQPDQMYMCEVCGYQGPAEPQVMMEKFPQVVGFDETPKSVICQALYSMKHVKIPAYATKQEDCGYLLLEFLQSTAMLRSVFTDKADKINSGKSSDWEDFYKIPIQYLGQMPDNAANVACIWVRPWQFYCLNDPMLVQQLINMFPDGAYAIFVNDEFMVAYPEKMDDHWTISQNPMGSNLYMRPLGENLATIQDIRAQLVEIELQTVEHGIPEQFADPRVLDFNKYGQSRSRPGMITQAKPLPGQTIDQAFYTTKPAMLSQEVDPLRQHIDQDAQFVTGSFASVYGGEGGGSKTASEYAQSRAQALQRLGTTWKIASEFWSEFQSRSATEYANLIKDLGQDVNFTKREGSSFVNTWIRASALQGKIGRVEPESADQLPITWAQKKETVMNLINLNNDVVLQALAHPRNLGIFKEILGLNEMYLPGEDARLRQFSEFSIMSQGIPVPINPMVDDEPIHIEVLKSILQGPVRESLSEEGFMACMMHLQEHEASMAAKMQQQQMAQQAVMQGPAPENNA